MSAHSTSSPLKMYFAVFFALLIGTGPHRVPPRLSTWAASNAAVALGIATIKATLVALFFFMHVWHASEKLTKLVVISALFFPCSSCWDSPCPTTRRVRGVEDRILLELCGDSRPSAVRRAKPGSLFGAL